ncbi:MAG TPA: alpha/beta hydrolase [Candidatus Polarisedimenticolia bacterium]|nr:alpha/beta hydrolase [Candidatus Polarisedimenticolia bacterium]
MYHSNLPGRRSISPNMGPLDQALKIALMLGLSASPSLGAKAPRSIDQDHYQAINGTRLHFRVRGRDSRNPYLLLLHGGPGASALEFLPWGSLLEDRLNVVYLDQRGCGLSERVRFKDPRHPTAAEARGFRFSDMVGDIEGVRKALGVEKWFVLGHSFGGMVGLEYVTAEPQHVLGYIHMDGLISMPMIHEDWLDYAERAVKKTASMRAPPADRKRIREVLDNIAKVRAMSPEDRDRNIGPMVIGKIMPEQIRDRFPAANAYDARIDAEVLTRYKITPDKLSASEPKLAIARNENLARRQVVSLFQKDRVPTLILNGAEDPIIPPKRARMMRRAVPHSQLVLIERAGHELYKDQPRRSAAAVLQFTAYRQPRV